MKNEILNQIVDQNGEWISFIDQNEQSTNHIVAKASLILPHVEKERSLFFKVYPSLPGLEEAVGRLTRMILGFGAPFTELYSFDGVPVLISQGVEGGTLNLIPEEERIQVLSSLDEESISGMILVAMLLNPEDGKPHNYVVEEFTDSNNEKTTRLIGIDNDQAFVKPFIANKKWSVLDVFKQKETKPQVKTILYCLNQMNNPIHPDVRNLFINMSFQFYLILKR